MNQRRSWFLLFRDLHKHRYLNYLLKFHNGKLHPVAWVEVHVSCDMTWRPVKQWIIPTSIWSRSPQESAPLIFHAIRHSWRWKLICLTDIFDTKTPQVYLHWFWWDESKKLNYLYNQPSHFYLWYFEMKMGLVPDVSFFFALFPLFLCRYNNRLHGYSSGPNKCPLSNKH